MYQSFKLYARGNSCCGRELAIHGDYTSSRRPYVFFASPEFYQHHRRYPPDWSLQETVERLIWLGRLGAWWWLCFYNFCTSFIRPLEFQLTLTKLHLFRSMRVLISVIQTEYLGLVAGKSLGSNSLQQSFWRILWSNQCTCVWSRYLSRGSQLAIWFTGTYGQDWEGLRTGSFSLKLCKVHQK